MREKINPENERKNIKKAAQRIYRNLEKKHGYVDPDIYLEKVANYAKNKNRNYIARGAVGLVGGLIAIVTYLKGEHVKKDTKILTVRTDDGFEQIQHLVEGEPGNRSAIKPKGPRNKKKRKI